MIGYVCAAEAIALTLMAYFAGFKYRQVPNEDETDLVSGKCREMSPMTSTHMNHHDYTNHHTNIIAANDNNGYAFNNHNSYNKTISSPECNQKPYIPG